MDATPAVRVWRPIRPRITVHPDIRGIPVDLPLIAFQGVRSEVPPGRFLTGNTLPTRDNEDCSGTLRPPVWLARGNP